MSGIESKIRATLREKDVVNAGARVLVDMDSYAWTMLRRTCDIAKRVKENK